MTGPDAESGADPELTREPLERIAESFLSRYRRGERPSLSGYVAANPELAEEIRELFPALVEIEGLKSISEADPPASRELPSPSRLGDYQILRVVGSGGMGVVYEAERESLRSRVALKVMHPHFRGRRSHLRRFHIEARAAARLHHTNIVGVFDYGEHDGVFYYAMQYIAGQALDRVIEDVRRLRRDDHAATTRVEAGTAGTEPPTAGYSLLTGYYAPPSSGDQEAGTLAVEGSPPTQADFGDSSGSSSLTGNTEGTYYREIARLGAQVADALAHAQAWGILHRDIKPSNLILDAAGNVWVTDFGLAKFEESDDLSNSHELVGTMRYMAPERFRGVSDRRCDIYALGATLYELATLRPAFEEADHANLIQRIAHEAPTPPRRVDPRIPRDLETIILRAMAKEPKDRFASAREMAEELRRFIDHRPIRSRAVPGYERLWRWCRRNPTLAAVNTLAASLMVVIAVISSWSAVGLRAERDVANRNLARAYNNEILAHTNAAEGRRMSRRVGQRFEALDEITKAVVLSAKVGGLDEAKRLHLRNEAIAAMALPDFRVEREIDITARGWRSQGFTLDRDFARYALPLEDGTVVVRRVADGRELSRLAGLRTDNHNQTSCFSPDGRYLAVSAGSGNILRVWNLEDGLLVFEDPEYGSGTIRAWDFSPDGRRLAVGHPDGSITLAELPSGRELWRKRFFTQGIGTIAFCPEGTRLAFGDLQSVKVGVCLADSGRLLRELPHPRGNFQVAWNPVKPDVLAVACEDNVIYQWNVAVGNRMVSLRGDLYNGLVIAYHPGGEYLASRGWNLMLRLWDTRTGRQVMTRQSSSWMPEILFDRDGGRLAAEVDSGKARVLEIAEGECRSLVADPYDAALDFWTVDVDKAGRNIAASDRQGVSIWDVKTGAYLARISTGQMIRYPTFDRSGALLTTQPWTLRWPVRYDSGGRGTLGPPELLQLDRTDDRISMSRAGDVLAMSISDDGVLTFDPAHPSRRHFIPVRNPRSIAVSPDGHWVVVSSHSMPARMWLWDAHSGRLVHELTDLWPDMYMVPSFSPDGKLLLGVGAEGSILIDTTTWKPRLSRLRGSIGRGSIGPSAFMPDSRVLGIVTEVGSVALLDVRDGHEIARFEDPEQVKATSLAFTPDGSHMVASVAGMAAIRVWDLRTIRDRLATLGLDWGPPQSKDSDAPSTRPVDPPRPRAFRVDRGHLDEWLKDRPTLYERVLARDEAELKRHPEFLEARFHRGQVLSALGRDSEAIHEFSLALGRGQPDLRVFEARGNSYLTLGDADRAIVDFDEVFRLCPDDSEFRRRILQRCNASAWDLASKRPVSGQANSAVTLARKVNQLAPGRQEYLNTLGVALYRCGQLAEAESVLTRSLEAGKGQFDAFDLFFLAMSHHRQGHFTKARDCFTAAEHWVKEQRDLPARYIQELAAFRAEAESVLSEAFVDLPSNVFARE